MPRFFALDPASGRVLRRLPIDVPPHALAVTSGGMLLAATAHGLVCLFDPEAEQ